MIDGGDSLRLLIVNWREEFWSSETDQSYCLGYQSSTANTSSFVKAYQKLGS